MGGGRQSKFQKGDREETGFTSTLGDSVSDACVLGGPLKDASSEGGRLSQPPKNLSGLSGSREFQPNSRR